MIKRLSGDYNRGYSRALLDLSDEAARVQEDCALARKRFGYPLMKQLLALFIQHRENFREGGTGFIRLNRQSGRLEYYDPMRGNIGR